MAECQSKTQTNTQLRQYKHITDKR